MYAVEHVLPMDNGLGEGPLWNAADQAVYWIDFLRAQFFRYDPASRDLRTFDLPYKPGCLAFVEGGGILLATTDGLLLWRDETVIELSDNALYHPPNRFNDGSADRQGRFWVGTASESPENHLYRLDPDGSVHHMETEIGISNGIGWSPDERVMYYSDSGGGGIVHAYDFDPATGAIDNRRTFLPPSGTGAVADGLTVDSEGCVWICFWDGWKVARYDPDGRLMTEIAMPVQRPTSCTFGGPGMNELYITSAGDGLDKAQQPQTGDLFKIITDVQGLPEPYVRLALPGE
jgi:sugar lactone lactonase YvrE